MMEYKEVCLLKEENTVANEQDTCFIIGVADGTGVW